jgi:hypothetical protein
MGFWTDVTKTTQDPKRAYRFVLTSGHIDQWIVTKVTKPNFEVSDTEHKYLNYVFHFPGRVTWNKISLTLVDPLNPDAAATMMAILEEGGYKPPTSPNDLATVSKGKSVAALGSIDIKQIDAEGKAVETWHLVNAWVSSAKFGELAYDSEEMTNIELEITYDFAYMITAGKSKQGGQGYPSNWAK